MATFEIYRRDTGEVVETCSAYSRVLSQVRFYAEFACDIVVAVTGGRNYADRVCAFRIFKRMLKTYNADRVVLAKVVHGACGWDGDKPALQRIERLKGADRFADEFALERGISVVRYPAMWTSQGTMAGPNRNRFMLDDAKPHLLMALPGNNGTRGCIKEARQRDIEVVTPGWAP